MARELRLERAMTSHPDFLPIDSAQLLAATGGAAAGQAELRALAKDYCPDVYAQFRTASSRHRSPIGRVIVLAVRNCA